MGHYTPSKILSQWVGHRPMPNSKPRIGMMSVIKMVQQPSFQEAANTLAFIHRQNKSPGGLDVAHGETRLFFALRWDACTQGERRASVHRRGSTWWSGRSSQ